MKFRIERDDLITAASTALRAANSGFGRLPALHLTADGDGLTIAASDGDISISHGTAIHGCDAGSAAVPARLFTDIVKAFAPGAVEVVTDDYGINLSSGTATYNLRILVDAVLFDLGVPEDHEVSIEASMLTSGLDQVIRAASSDAARPLLTGVSIESNGDDLRLAATDSYRLAICDIFGLNLLEDSVQVLIPSNALSEVRRIIKSDTDTIKFSHDEDRAIFPIGGTTITTRLIAGTYPDYRQLVPESYPTAFTVSRSDLLDAVKRVKLLARDNTTPVRFDVDGGTLKLSCKAQELGDATDTVNGACVGADCMVAFNPTYLIDGLEAIVDDDVVVELLDANKPATLSGIADKKYKYLLMPVRVSD